MIMAASFAALIPNRSYALPASHYGESSVLASGRWAKVKINETGMTLVTDAELRKMGFNNPSKVHVFGLGGRQLANGFHKDTPDDLPLIPSIRTDKGLVFFATDHFTWKSQNNPNRPYIHTIHPYSDDNYYFLSDIDIEEEMADASGVSTSPGSEPLTEFTGRFVYEKEIEPAGTSGSQAFGEDFRALRNQTFSIKMPDRVANTDATVFVRFAAKTTNGNSTISYKVNGRNLGESDRIASVNSTTYTGVSEASKTIKDSGESLDFGIEYSQTGVLYKARLDYLEVFYTRSLKLKDGELHFYGNFISGQSFSIAGCSASTVIWDVTNPVVPKKVNYSLNGDKALFSISMSGYREFVAFTPESVTRTAKGAGNVANQNLHSHPTPDMLIITLETYRAGAEKIAAMHEEKDGFRVSVLTPDEIYNEFSGGKPDVGAFRKLLKMWYDRGVSEDGHSIKYCLLMGKPSYDNKMLTKIGYTPLLIYQNYDGYTDETSYSTDDFIGMLDDVSDVGFNILSAPIRVAIGRLPVTSASQSLQMADKIRNFVENAELGVWRNKIMIIADDEDNGVHLRQAENAYSQIMKSDNGASFVYDRVYLDAYKRVMTGVGPTYPQVTEKMLANYNDGVMMTCYIGHANDTGWGHEHLWDYTSITSMTNKNLPFIYAATCDFCYWDKPSLSGAEELMLNPKAGVIGMITASRKVYIDRNAYMTNAVMPSMFTYGDDGMARTFGEAYRLARNTQLYSNSLRYLFLGDPAIKIPNPSYRVSINEINGENLEDAGDNLPELKARSCANVSGTILRPDGSVADDFNGTLNLQLFDGERVITTYGQGDSGTVMSYNDRDQRLSMTTASVKDGYWTAELRVPPEIRGNYTRALLAAYAWNEDRIEANGTSDQLYVFGYNEDESDDTEGPVIEYFYVNTPNFTNGDLVNANPVVMARMSDKSGINISDSGIGHAMSLTVDNKDVYSDLNAYFRLDGTDSSAGILTYPLSGITPGKHTLELTVWDNANNVSKSLVDINVGAATDPVIYGITASVTDASVDFRIELDRPNTSLRCDIGIFDLGGRRIWSLDETLSSDMQSNITTNWNMCDSSGNRVARGIYIYRVTVETPEGTYSSKSKKIAISAAQ